MTDTPSKPRKILGVNKSADTAKDDERDPFDTVRSGPRGRVALQRARELKASQPAPAPVKRAPRPAEGKAPRPSGERKPWVKREGTDAAQRGPRTEGKRPPRDANAARPPRPAPDGQAPRPAGERKPWVKREGTDAAQRGPRTEGKRPPRDASAMRTERPKRDAAIQPRTPRPAPQEARTDRPPRRDGAAWTNPGPDTRPQPRSQTRSQTRAPQRPRPDHDTRPVIDESDIPPSQRRYDRPAPREGQAPNNRRPAAPVRVTQPLPAPAPGTYRWFAPCPRGLEQPLLAELNTCGASDARAVPGGCQFVGPLELGWRVNLHSRIASRVLREITQTAYRNEHDLYDAAMAIDWPALFDPSQTFKVETVGVNANVPSIEFVTLRVKDAVCDRMREATGTRPDVETRTPDVRVHLFMDPSVAVFYVDTSGEALFKRGWRLDKVAAPLRENLAAGMLALAGWTPGTPLLDPFCGSGTIPIEAALIAQGRAAGANRSFGFQHLKDFDAARWQTLLDEAKAQAHEQGDAHIYAGDISINAIPIARTNAARAGVHIELKQVDAREMQAPCEQPGVMLCNPPYGERVHVRGKVSQAREDALDEQFDDDHAFFAEFATTLKRRFAGWKVAILSSDPELPSKMRLKPAKAWQLYNGALACRLYVFEIVAGSNR